tara:strand:- start:487 stop:903 length:417 start_codon:yes stop_codon:yes gene_type:complete
MRKINLLWFFLLFGCATLQPTKYPVKIELNTVNQKNEPIDSVCTVFSSSNKVETLTPNTITFLTECSSINVMCKSGDKEGQYGMIQEDDSAENFIINSGIGYLFDRAVDAITPMGQLLNLMGSDDCEMTDQKITIVLE